MSSTKSSSNGDPPPADVASWVHFIKQGDEAGAEQLWNQYHRRLIAYVRSRFPAISAESASDVVNSVFNTLFARARDGKLDPAENRQGVTGKGTLEAMLFTIAFRKTARAIARKKKSREQSVGREELVNLVADEPDALEGELNEHFQQFQEDLKRQDSRAYEVLMWRIREPEIDAREIAGKMGISIAKVDRKLESLETILKHAMYG